MSGRCKCPKAQMRIRSRMQRHVDRPRRSRHRDCFRKRRRNPLVQAHAIAFGSVGNLSVQRPRNTLQPTPAREVLVDRWFGNLVTGFEGVFKP
jgi:hypothetical protein